MDKLIDDRMELLKDITKLKNVLGNDNNDDEDDDEEDEDEFCYIEEDLSEEEFKNDHSSLSENNSAKKDYLSILQNDLDFISLEPNNNLKLCLLMNQSYQNALLDKIVQLQTMLESNLEHQKNLQEEIDENDREKNIPSNRKMLVTFQAPYFKDVNGQIPPLNEDAKIKIKNKEVTAYVIPNKPWSDSEKEHLENAVASNFKEKLLAPLLLKKSILKDKLAQQNMNDEDHLAATKKLEEIQSQITNIKEKSKRDCIGPRGSSLDWMKISVVGLNGNRSPEECELMWNNFIHPSINKEPWTEIEKRLLLEVAEKYQYKNWDTISERLQTNRTAWQCLQKYQQELPESHVTGPWTKEEDNLLKEVVEACRVGNYIPWHQVAYYLEGRSRSQLQERWRRTKLRKGHWRKLEDMILVTAVKKHGENWIKVARYLPGRSNNQCRERYKNSLEENVILGSWTAAEDKKLLRLVKKFGEGKWAQIAQYLPGRTDNSIYQRYRLIISKIPNALETVHSSENENEDVDNDKPLTRTVSCQKKIERRNTVYQAIHDQILNLKMEEPSTSAESITENLNGINITTINRLLNKMLPSLRQNITPYSRKKTKKEKSVDSALDAFLLPVTLINIFPKRKHTAMGVSEATEWSISKSFLFKYFRLENATNENDGIVDINQQPNSDMANLFTNFLIGKNIESLGNEIPIFPPNRTSLNSFALILSNRKRLILASKKVQNVNAISTLTARSVHTSAKCASCLYNESYELSQNMNFHRNPYSYSAKQNNAIKKANSKPSTNDLTTENTNQLSNKRKLDADSDQIPKKAKIHSEEGKDDDKSSNEECLSESASLSEKNEDNSDYTEIKQHCFDKTPDSACEDCSYAKTLHDDFQLLKMRFLATFFWPGLLSTINPNFEKPNLQNLIMGKYKRCPRRLRGHGIRKKKKPWVSQILKKRHLEQNHTLKTAPEKKSRANTEKRIPKVKPKEVQVLNPKPTRRSLRQAGIPPAGSPQIHTRSMFLEALRLKRKQ